MNNSRNNITLLQSILALILSITDFATGTIPLGFVWLLCSLIWLYIYITENNDNSCKF